MNFLGRNLKALMLVSGVLTSCMLYVVIWPAAAMRSMFGVSLEGSALDIVVRDWGFLIFLTGVLLIYGGLRPVHRAPVIVFSCAGKAMFVALVLALGGQAIRNAWPAVAFDAGISVLLMCGLLSATQSDTQ